MLGKFLTISIFLVSSFAWASAPDEAFKKELSQRFPGARVELGPSGSTCLPETYAEVSHSFTKANFLSDPGMRDTRFRVYGAGKSCDVTVSFSAWVPARVALRRINSGEKLSPDLFIQREVDVAQGQGFEYRGVILGQAVDLNSLETRQTVLPGQFLVTTAVQKVPDVRRGDQVRIHLLSNDLTLSTLGTAEEPGYIHGQVKVMTLKTKRELSGILAPGGVIEVKL